jgi:exopolysaccharide biosynthesis polyprenyl glycosylphosphotransferase
LVEDALDSRESMDGSGGGPRGRRGRQGRAVAIARPVDRFGRPDKGFVSRMFGQVSPELLGLWLAEVLVCSLLIYIVLSRGLADGTVAAVGMPMHVANQAAALALTFGLTSAAVGLYSPDVYLRTRALLLNTALGALLAFPLIWLVGRGVGLDLAGISTAGAKLAVKVLLAWTLVLFCLRLAFSYALRADLFVRRVLIVGSDASAARIAGAIRSLRQGFFEVAAVVPAEDLDALAPRQLREQRVWGVIVTADACARLEARQVLRASGRGLRLYSDTDFWERQLRRIDVDQIGVGPAAPAVADEAGADAPAASSAVAAPVVAGRAAAAVQRAADIVLSLTLLAFTLPLMLLTAIAIRVDSRGPVLYRQERVGLHGRSFTVLKFRSMRTDAEARGPMWAAKRDPRVTRVGAMIRLTRIDELPQLLNVLRGEMGFIGPRPERPHFVEQLEQALPFYRDRALVKPGLTGWAQVNYPYGASVEDARAKLSYDLYYVKHRGPMLDLLILAATVRVVLFQRGAR